jgi:transcriptional regulator with XRE-family HTH domain
MKETGPGNVSPRSPSDVDRLVGENVRKLRTQRNLTLAQLAGELGISHQQLQKYETGMNRLSAGTLCNVAAALCVPIEALFLAQVQAVSKTTSRKDAILAELRTEGSYWLNRSQSEQTLRQMVQVLKALSSDT